MTPEMGASARTYEFHGERCPRCGHVWTYESGACPDCVYDPANRPRLLELAACEGGATAGYQAAGWHVTAVDLDGAALRRNPADVTVQVDALEYLGYVPPDAEVQSALGVER